MANLKTTVKHLLKNIMRPVLSQLADYFDSIITPGKQSPESEEKINHNNIIHCSKEFKRVQPIHTGSLHAKFFEEAPGITRYSESTYFEVFSGAKVVGPHGAVISKENKLILHLSPEIGAHPENHSLLSGFIIKRPFYLNNFSLLMSGPDASLNYFHWMTDALPKITIAQKAGYFITDFNHFIVNNIDKPFQRESLAEMGIPPDCIISLKQNPYLICEKLFAPSPTCLSGNVSPWIIEFLRISFSLWMIPVNSSPRKIYISRKTTDKRRMVNEVEVAEFLKKQGYISVILEELSLREQVALFYNAENIIGPHGAGFTNIIFCKPGTQIIELFPDSYVNQCFWTIASINQMKYGYVLGVSEKTTDVNRNHLVESDFTISINNIHDLQRIFN